MITKTVYFVRHAQTDGNTGDIQLGADAQVTEHGQDQIQALTKRLSDEKFDTCLSSPYQRALDTVEAIAYNQELKIQTHSCLVERRRPSEVYGQPKRGTIAQDIKRQTKENYEVPGWRYSDEENFEDLSARAGEIIDVINSVEGENILCMTHGYIMRIIVARILFGDKLTASICREFVRTMHLENTGICEFRQVDGGKWFLWRWNDHAHLKT